mmetsp:Transcript_7563/g.19074  ORF Transcript_7563/g.19074 Transcript_7563/m.19074 type:complete len:265 (+) Transcript_7563:91-885(+)
MRPNDDVSCSEEFHLFPGRRELLNSEHGDSEAWVAVEGGEKFFLIYKGAGKTAAGNDHHPQRPSRVGMGMVEVEAYKPGRRQTFTDPRVQQKQRQALRIVAGRRGGDKPAVCMHDSCVVHVHDAAGGHTQYVHQPRRGPRGGGGDRHSPVGHVGGGEERTQHGSTREHKQPVVERVPARTQQGDGGGRVHDGGAGGSRVTILAVYQQTLAGEIVAAPQGQAVEGVGGVHGTAPLSPRIAHLCDVGKGGIGKGGAEEIARVQGGW